MNPRLVERSDGSVEFWVHVHPNAARSEVSGIRGDALTVRVDAPPEDGAANEAVRRLLAAFLGVAPRQVTIVHGSRRRRKLVRVSGIDAAALRARLGQLA